LLPTASFRSGSDGRCLRRLLRQLPYSRLSVAGPVRGAAPAAEARLEPRWCALLEFDSAVLEGLSQPVKIQRSRWAACLFEYADGPVVDAGEPRQSYLRPPEQLSRRFKLLAANLRVCHLEASKISDYGDRVLRSPPVDNDRGDTKSPLNPSLFSRSHLYFLFAVGAVAPLTMSRHDRIGRETRSGS
jgi:hypothetical protein